MKKHYDFMMSKFFTFLFVCILMLFVQMSVRGEDSDHLHLFCLASPGKSSWTKAMPSSFEESICLRRVHHEIDEHGEGVVWGLAHWVDIEDPPLAPEQAEMGEQFTFKAVAHLLVFREFWLYEKDSSGKLQKKEWVRRTVRHIRTGEERGNATSVMVKQYERADGKYEIEGFNAAAHSNRKGFDAIHWNGKAIGWVSVALLANGTTLTTDYRWHPGSDQDKSSDKRNTLSLRNRSYHGKGGFRELRWSFASFQNREKKEAGFDPAGLVRSFVLPQAEDITEVTQGTSTKPSRWLVICFFVFFALFFLFRSVRKRST